MHIPSPLHVLTKPTGARCNLNCAYCFFLSKSRLYPCSSQEMTPALLENYIRQLCARGSSQVNLSWQGGEPTLMGLDFFRLAVSFAEKHRLPGQEISHTIQTNGTLLDDNWCAFFKEHHFLVGLSLDGPETFHDAYRTDTEGRGTFHQVRRSWERLRHHQVDCNILCAVHDRNVRHPLEVYRFFRDDLECRHLQFLPIVERQAPASSALYTQTDTTVTDRSVPPSDYGDFLIAIYDHWVRHDVGRVFVQSFDVALGNWLGQYHLCLFSPLCGRSVVLEHNGDVYSCDHYVEPGYRLGSIETSPLSDLTASPFQQAFGQKKSASLPKACRECDVLFACYGECPRNRFLRTDEGEEGLNYLCAGYQKFFRHIAPTMKLMAALLRQNRCADEIMPFLNKASR